MPCFYACSEDGGKTWKKAYGTPITALPMRAIPGPSQADAVASFNQNGILVEYFASNDLTGNPTSVNIVQRMSPPSAMANSARWSGEIAFPEAGTYSLEFHAKGSDALMTVINKQKGAQDRVNAGLNDGNAEQFEAEKGMTMGYTIEWKRSKKYPGMFTPGIKWQLAGHPQGGCSLCLPAARGHPVRRPCRGHGG